MTQKGQELLDELSEIFDKCRDYIEARNHISFTNLAEHYMAKEDGEEKLNMLKTILLISKNVPSFFPEITEIRQRVKDVYNELYRKIIGSEPH